MNSYVRTNEGAPEIFVGEDQLEAIAVRMMEERGLNRVEELLSLAIPERIIGACEWWDERRSRSRNPVHPELLAWKIRQGGEELRAGSLLIERPCPVTPQLRAAWAPVSHRLRELLGRPMFEIWIAPLHPHEHSDAGWVLGGPTATVTWTMRRFGRFFDRAAAVPVRVVGCGHTEERP